MPQPVNLSGSAKPTKAILQRPRCAIQVAAIVAEWAYLEDMLVLLFSSAMGSHTVDASGGVSVSRNWVALSTMQELTLLITKLIVIDKSLMPFMPEDIVKEWNKLSEEIRRRGKERNKVAHASWGISDKYPNHLILEDGGKYMTYSESDLVEILDRISSTRAEVYNFMQKVLLAKRDGRAIKVQDGSYR